VDKAFYTIWIDSLLYKLTLLNFSSYIVHSISSYLKDRTFEASFQTSTLSRRGMRAGVALGGLISPVHFSLYVNDMPPHSHHVEFALYADDTPIIATSLKPTLLVSYLECYLNYLQRWLSDWRIAINVINSTAIIFARAGRRIFSPISNSVRGTNRMCRYYSLSGVTLDKRLTCSPHIGQFRWKTAKSMGMLGPLLNRKSDLSVSNRVPLYKQLIRSLMVYACPAWKSAACSHVRRL